MAKYDIAIRVPDDGRALYAIRKARRVVLHCRPKRARIPGSVIALVQSEGAVAVTARVVGIKGPCRVRLLNGSWRDRGYVLKLTEVIQPYDSYLGIRWRAIGQFRYFDARAWKPAIVGPITAGNGAYLENEKEETALFRRAPFSGGVPGVPHNHPESTLVRQYVAWLRAEHQFANDYYPGRYCCDLFDRSRWRLLEAKVHSDRGTLRQALGQVLDYKRFYARKPSVGVLLGSRPSSACIDFLDSYGVAAVWRTKRGRFSDSTPQRQWTKGRRCARMG